MSPATLRMPWLLLGGSLILDPTTVTFLASTAVAWTLAGWAALARTRGDPQRVRFLAFFVLTMTASLVATVAGDPITFFFAYSVLGLAAYPLIVYERTSRAVRTARWYVVFMIAGEGAVLAATLLLTDASGASAFPAGIASVGVSILVLVGFGVKCGVPGLHAWMPATYAAAPWPVAAALAGGTVGVGILGFMRFGLATPGSTVTPHVWIALGTAGAVFGVVRGLVRREPERILAYSSVSQMGVALAVLGFGAESGADATSLSLAIGAFVGHHALAKTSLFVGVGAVRGGTRVGGRRDHPVLVAMVAIPALALAGVPLTSGALAKGAMVGAVGGAGLDRFLQLSSAGTTLLMLHFFATVLRITRAGGRARPRTKVVIAPWAFSVATVVIGVWAWPPFRSMATHALDLSVILHAVPPLATGGVAWALFAAAGWKGTRRVSLADRTARRVGSMADRWLESRREVRPELRHLPVAVRRAARHIAARGESRVATLDRRVGTWTLTGTLFMGLLLVLRALL